MHAVAAYSVFSHSSASRKFSVRSHSCTRALIKCVQIVFETLGQNFRRVRPLKDVRSMKSEITSGSGLSYFRFAATNNTHREREGRCRRGEIFDEEIIFGLVRDAEKMNREQFVFHGDRRDLWR